jgi:hypothetical protein
MKRFFLLLPILVILAACGANSIPPTVYIMNPSSQINSKDSVTIQVTVTGEPDTVEVLKNGIVVATLNAPYQYTWNTSQEPEGTYTLMVRATKRGFAPVFSNIQQIKVNRLPLRIAPHGAYDVG